MNIFRKPVDTLLYQEIVTLLGNNEELAEEVRNEGIKNAAFWLEEYLHDISGCDYSITNGHADYTDHFTIEDRSGFENWFDSVMHDYELFSDKEAETIREYLKVGETFDHIEQLWHYGYSPYTGKYGLVADKDFHNVEGKAQALEQEANEIVFNRLRSEFDYWVEADGEELAEMFGCYMDNHHYGEELYTDSKMINIFEYSPEITITYPESETVVI